LLRLEPGACLSYDVSKSLRWNGHQNDISAVQHLAHVSRSHHRGIDDVIWQIARIAMITVDAFHQGGIAQPLVHFATIVRCDAGQRRAEATTAQNRYRHALISHTVSNPRMSCTDCNEKRPSQGAFTS